MYVEYFCEYYVVLIINVSIIMKNVKKCLKRYFDFLDEKKFLKIDEMLKKLFQCVMEILDKFVEENGEFENFLLMYLKELILKNYKDLELQ